MTKSRKKFRALSGLIVTDRTRSQEPWFVLTGHTLMVGDVGRTELVAAAEQGARDLFTSLERLKALPDYLEVLPGALAGSVCGRGLSGNPVSTIGFERRGRKRANALNLSPSFGGGETTAARADCLVVLNGFEPEISLTVLPRTQSETPVRRLLRLEQVKPALNAAKLPTDGSVVGHRRLAGWTNSWRSRTLGQCARCVRIFADWTFLFWRPPLALVSLLEFAPVGPAPGA